MKTRKSAKTSMGARIPVRGIGRVALAAAAVCAAAARAADYDLAGASLTVDDSTFATYAEYDGITNSSATQATLTFDIETAATYSGTIGGAIKLEKSGSATLTLSALARTYTGGTLVSEGMLKLGNIPTCIGAGDLTIADGAAVDFNGCLASGKAGFPNKIYAAGTGISNAGALRNTGTQFGNNGFNNLYLTGDVLIKTGYRMNFVTVHTQGHTLRYQGGSQVAFSTIDNSQGGDVSIESGQYTAWGTVNALGNTPSKGKVYMKGGRLTFYANLSVANNIVVTSASRLNQGQSGSTAKFTGAFTLENTLTVDGGQKINFAGSIGSTNGVKTLQISDGNVPVTFSGCTVSNVAALIYRGTTTIGSGTKWYSPSGQFRHLMQGSSQVANLTSTLNINDGSETTVAYFSSGNTSSSTAITGIVNQVGGTFRTVSCYNTTEYDGIRLGHYPSVTTHWNISGGRLVVEGDSNNLNLSINGRGELNITGGEVTTPTLKVNARQTSTGYGVLNMTGGELNIGAGGITKTGTQNRYAITLGGGTVRASAAGGFSSAFNMALTGSSGTNVTFDTQSAAVTLSGILSGEGGLRKAGTGTLTLSGANTYAGATTVEGGTVAFTQAYPGGDLEISASALTNAASSIVTAASVAFAEGKGVRILDADALDKDTFGATRTIASSTAQIAALPPLTLVASDGTAVENTGKWDFRLSSDGRALKFGPRRGLMILVR